MSRVQTSRPTFYRTKASLLVFAIGVLIPSLGFAKQSIEFAEGDLASESVHPVFDNAVSVRNRSVVTTGRMELGLGVNYLLMEPFFAPAGFGGVGTYHFNEDHAFNVMASMFTATLNDNGKALNPIPGTTAPPINANLQKAPAPKYMLLANHQFTGFYGKISLSKEFVMNLHLYGLWGLGVYGIGDGIFPTGNFGIGQKFYFNQRFALRFDLRFLVYQGPDVVSKRILDTDADRPASSFDQRLFFSSVISAGAVFLL
jgi:outer membrane beta-barrel protein